MTATSDLSSPPRRHANLVTSADLELLRSLAQQRSVVEASRRLGMSRDRAVYRLARLARAFGGPVVRGTRGGAGHGGTLLTPLGDRVARGGFDSVELIDARPLTPTTPANLLRGVYRRFPNPEVRVGRSLRLRVAFPAEDGETVSMLLDPETVVVARRRFPSSARNVLRGTVESLHRTKGTPAVTLVARCSGTRLRVALTDEPVRQLGLRRGVPLLLYVKATALRRVEGAGAPTRGSPRS
ncbi:MAG TPA: TOBE domain-containing protein [Thermoplasmata archaeon]|nr:TOBE domain-containing protein [Thermoplasmata archaeon]